MIDRQASAKVSAPPPLPAYGSLIVRVISEARKNFTSGAKNIERFKKQNSASFIIEDPEYQLARKKDVFFQHDISPVPDSCFFSGSVPSHQQLPTFIQDIAYNRHLTIHYIVSFNESIPSSSSEPEGFNNLCAREKSFLAGPYSVNIENVVKVQSNLLQSQALVKFRDADFENMNGGAHYYQRLNFMVIDLKGSQSFQLADDSHHAIKDVLWQLSGLSENILVQSASGVGCNGQLILTLAIFKQFNQIFASKNPVVIAARLHELLTKLRTNSPGLIMTEEQFFDAIRNADILHNYALEKNYILKPSAMIKSKSLLDIKESYFSFFSSKPQVVTQQVKKVELLDLNPPPNYPWSSD